MKTLRFKGGKPAGETMTVGELQAALTAYPPDMPVFAEWEGVLAFIHTKNMGIEVAQAGHPDDADLALVIDVNEYW